MIEIKDKNGNQIYQRDQNIYLYLKDKGETRKLGYDVQIRLSPYIIPYVDVDIINNIKCDKIVVEFLRVNHWIKKWFNIDYSEYTHNEGGYQHLPIEKKIKYLSKIKKPQITVCEDVQKHYEYWKKNVNYNSKDCCNLRFNNK